jgi:hypothetical protein
LVLYFGLVLYFVYFCTFDFYFVDDDVEEVHEVPPKKGRKRAEKIAWTQEEEEALAKAWIHISTCRVVGNEQPRDKFWERVTEHFATLMNGTTRTHHSLNTKWNLMNPAMSVFNGLYHQSVIFTFVLYVFVYV